MVKSLLSYVFEEKLLRKGKLLVFWTWPSFALNLYWRWFVLLTAFLPVMSWVVNCACWWLVKVVRGEASLKGREIWIKPVRLPTSNMLQLNLAAASADTSILRSLWSSHCDKQVLFDSRLLLLATEHSQLHTHVKRSWQNLNLLPLHSGSNTTILVLSKRLSIMQYWQYHAVKCGHLATRVFSHV